MITEDYVSFETAKLLKEKGFDEKCQKVYMHNGQLLWAQIFMEGESFVNNKSIALVANYNDWITYTQGEYAYLCPTLQMAMKWLRDTYKIFIEIKTSIDLIGNPHYAYFVLGFDGDYRREGWTSFEWTYEKCCDEAIKYCLEILDKIEKP